MNRLELLERAEAIHFEELCKDVEVAIRPIHQLWARDGTIDPFIIMWPSAPIPLTDGSAKTGPQLRQLPKNQKEWGRIIEETATSLRADAICFAHPTATGARVVFETPRGTRCWQYTRELRGDVWRLGDAQVSDNQEYLGVLWSPAAKH
jgi:hypothetical protein